MQRRHHQEGSINQRLIKLKQGQKTAFPFPLMVSPRLCKRQALTSSLNPYSLPFFIPLHFACRRRPNPFHLFVPFSIAMFSGLGFTPFFHLMFFCKLVSKFVSMCIKLCHRLNYFVRHQTNFAVKRSLPRRRTTKRLCPPS